MSQQKDKDPIHNFPSFPPQPEQAHLPPGLPKGKIATTIIAVAKVIVPVIKNLLKKRKERRAQKKLDQANNEPPVV